MSGALDGNVLAGALREIFAVDVTTATGQCAGCGQVNAVAEVVVYADGPGSIGRCPACDSIVLRLVRGAGRAWLDLRGVVCLELEVPDEA